MEDIGADSDLNFGVLSREVLEEKNISMWPRDSFSDILVKNVSAFALVKESAWG